MKRDVFSWCGRLTRQVPECGWLRPACSFIKRMVNAEATWDQQVPEPLLKICDEVEDRLAREGDPVRGQWSAGGGIDESTGCTVWADASDIDIGVAIEVNSSTLEDRSWLRLYDDKPHINISELEATIRGLSLAANWQIKRVRLMTDSKTVASWLGDVIDNVRRTRTKGLHEVLVQRRLPIVSDMIVTSGIDVSVDWVPTARNGADALTRVSAAWIKHCHVLKGDGDTDVTAAAAHHSWPSRDGTHHQGAARRWGYSDRDIASTAGSPRLRALLGSAFAAGSQRWRTVPEP